MRASSSSSERRARRAVGRRRRPPVISGRRGVRRTAVPAQPSGTRSRQPRRCRRPARTSTTSWARRRTTRRYMATGQHLDRHGTAPRPPRHLRLRRLVPDNPAARYTPSRIAYRCKQRNQGQPPKTHRSPH
jgi:hypothetical protein